MILQNTLQNLRKTKNGFFNVSKGKKLYIDLLKMNIHFKILGIHLMDFGWYRLLKEYTYLNSDFQKHNIVTIQ
jgi:hypothetical protein